MTRILHVVGGMNRGGVETWLMHILRNIDRKRFHMDFMVHTHQRCAYDEEILTLGSEILPCMHPSSPWRYARNFRRLLRAFGSYDIVHSHVHHYSGYVLRLAHRARVPVRIAHSHNDTAALRAGTRLTRSLYLMLMESWIRHHATIGLACSNKAGAALFGPFGDERWSWRILPYAIDLTPFVIRSDASIVRAELGIPVDALVVGHVGRFDEQKNHAFMVEIAIELARRENNMSLLLIGDGPLRSGIKKKVAEARLNDRVLFTGIRSDVPRLMSAMDVFLFPSLFEGLGLVFVEAQAAGLPCVIADVIPKEADVVEYLISRMSHSQPAAAWAEAILAARAIKRSIGQPEALARVLGSTFNIQTAVKHIEKFYSSVHSGNC
jgi:glycosyltransferase involved in cell wall biosynthesis